MDTSAGDKLPYVLKHFRFSYLGLFAALVWSFSVMHRSGIDYGSTPVSTTTYLSLAVAMLTFIALRRVFPTVSWERVLQWPTAIVMAAVTCLLTYPFEFTAQLSLFASVVAGFCIAFTYLSWADFFSKMDTRNIIALIFSTCILASVVKVVVDLSPAFLATIILSILPLFGAVLLMDAKNHRPPAEAEPTIYFSSVKDYLPWKILLGVAAYSLIIGITPGVAGTPAPMSQEVLSLVHHGIEIVLCLIVLWWVFFRHGHLQFSNLWRAVLLLTATGLFFLPVLSPELIGWSLLLIAVAQTLVVMLFWAMLTDTARHSAVSSYTIFGVAWVVYVVPIALGQQIGSALASANDSFLITLCAYVLTLVAVFALNENNLIESRVFAEMEMKTPPRKMFAGIDEGCVELGKRYGLTQREVEITQLLCKGRSKNYIAQTLIISENTVRTHSRHIFSKLDVHSKQEILDMVDDL